MSFFDTFCVPVNGNPLFVSSFVPPNPLNTPSVGIPNVPDVPGKFPFNAKSTILLSVNLIPFGITNTLSPFSSLSTVIDFTCSLINLLFLPL